MSKHAATNGEGKPLNPGAYQDVFNALKIAEMQILNDYNTRVQQGTEKAANKIILEVIAKALAKAEKDQP